MKRTKIIKALFPILFIFCICLSGFAQSTSKIKEIGYIIFDQDTVVFENPLEAKELLDIYVKNINEIPSKEKQIHINGFSAIFSNNIDPIKLSMDRANVIFDELLLRGVSAERIGAIKGNGETSNWGNNNVSASRKPNRRVTISIDEYNETSQAIVTSEMVEKINTPDYNIKQDANITKIGWGKIAIIIGIILAVVAIILLVVFVIAPAFSSTSGGIPSNGLSKTPPTNIPQKRGGYFGELKQQIQKTGQDGTREVHHMPCDSSLFVANKLDHGSAPAIIMDAADHAKTASFGNSVSANVYQTEQLDLLKAGKFDEALQMDIDDLISKGLYSKYESAIKEMQEYIRVLKNEGRL